MDIEIGSLTVGVWGIFAAVGIGAGVLLIIRRARERPDVGLSAEQVLNIAFWAVISAIIGARLLYVAVSPEIHSFAEVVAVHRGGLSAFGAIIGAGIVGVVYVRKLGISILEAADIAAPGVLLAEGIVRVGSFVVRNHPGRITEYSWLAVSGPDGLPRHEVGLYLSIAAFIGLIGILFLEQRYRVWLRANPGFIAVVMFTWYSITRLFLDFLRAADLPMSDPRFAGLTITQYMAIVSLVCIAGYGAYWRKKYAIK